MFFLLSIDAHTRAAAEVLAGPVELARGEALQSAFIFSDANEDGRYGAVLVPASVIERAAARLLSTAVMTTN